MAAALAKTPNALYHYGARGLGVSSNWQDGGF